MKDSAPASGDLALSRYECKYFVRPQVVERMRRFMRAFVRPDLYAARHRDCRYTVCSLYLDSPDLVLYGMTAEGQKNRFKLRIRRYADAADAPLFLEIKRRVDTVVLKQRTRVSCGHVDSLLESLPGLSREPSPLLADNSVAEEFRVLARRVKATPLMRVKYEREAYESIGGDPVRITFDTELVHSVTTENTTASSGGVWDPTPLDGVIVEIKFTHLYPSWVRGMIDTFQLQQQSIAKYALSVEDAVDRGRYRPTGCRPLDAVTRLGSWSIGV